VLTILKENVDDVLANNKA